MANKTLKRRIQAKAADLFMQIIPVMIGVYLAFWVADRSAKKQDIQNKDFLVEGIKKEMKTNEEKLVKVIDYHVMLRDSARHYMRSESVLPGRPPFFEGLRTGNLVSSAYETGKQTGIINELPMEKIQILNQIYTFQDSYNEFQQMTLEALINKNTYGEGNRRSMYLFIATTMSDIVIKETELISIYGEFENYLGDGGKKKKKTD